MSREETSALRKLKPNKEIIILKANKGNATVVMNTYDYHRKMIEHMTMSGGYKKVEKDPSNKIIWEITRAIQNSSLDDSIKKKITPNPIVPRIYRLPKVHKDICPLRPIVNTIGLPSYGLARLFRGKNQTASR